MPWSAIHLPHFGSDQFALSPETHPPPCAQTTPSRRGMAGLDYRPADLEEMLVVGADQHPGGGAWSTVSCVFTEMEEVRLARTDGRFARAAEGEEADATLSIGPSNLGGFVRFAPIPQRTPTGLSIAPRAVALFAFADRELETGIGLLEPARELGSRS